MRPMSQVLERAGDFFMKRSPQHEALQRLATRLDELGIPYVIAGAMAVNAHGHELMTSDVDVLLTKDGLAAFKSRWLGRGWVEVFPGAKGMRDTQDDVKIDVLIAGDFPGDRKPKPIAFPDPASSREPSTDGWPVLPLRTLVELKLASGMTAPHRLQDLADVMNLVRANHLPEDFDVHPYVREKYAEMWTLAQTNDDS